ncbi:MAG TPA: hypothetical protein VNP72_07570 [Longimicrobium sp.]|nr:hypothetical protein [Longimicrobium sp.]
MHPTITGRTICLFITLGTAVSACSPALAPAEKGSHRWVAELFVSPTGWPELRNHVGGEMAKDTTNPQLHIPPENRVKLRLVSADSARALYAATVSGDKGPDTDAYLYLYREDGTWKIHADRIIRFPGTFIDNIEAMERAAGDSAATVPAIRKARLMMGPDADLIAYFEQNRALADRVAAGLEANPGLAVWSALPGQSSGTPISAELRRDVDGLNLLAAGRDAAHPGCLFLVVGQVYGIQVGYLRAPRGCAVPRPAPTGFLYVEELAPGWYAYRRTDASHSL